MCETPAVPDTVIEDPVSKMRPQRVIQKEDTRALEWVTMLLFVNEPFIVYKLSPSIYSEVKNELITIRELEICPLPFLSGSHSCTDKGIYFTF